MSKSKKHFFKIINLKALQYLNYLASPFNHIPNNLDVDSILGRYIPIFIVGAPRSGTTLLYQLICKHYNVGYINNFVGNWYQVPNLAARIFTKVNRDYNLDSFESDYGSTKHLTGTHEFGDFWYRWFPRDAKTKDELKLNPSQIINIRKEIAYLSYHYKSPVVFKNVFNSIRVLELAKVFPTSIFIEIQRDKLDNAQSILNARIKLHNNKNKWVGVKPFEYSSIRKLPYWEQIPIQIDFISEEISKAKKVINGNRFLTLEYSDLCQTTTIEMEKIYNFIQAHYLSCQVNYDSDIKLAYSTGKKVALEDYEHLNNQISNKL